MKSRYKVMIVEDHQMLREGLKAILSTQNNLEIVGEASDGLSALRTINQVRPDIVLLDLSMPRMTGLSVLMEAKNNHPEIKVLVITVHQSDERVKEVFSAGADGYLSKYDSKQEFLTAINSVLAGDIYLSPAISKHVLAGYLANVTSKKSKKDVWDTLSQREKEILKLLAEGYTNKQIGDMLYISAKTAEKHRSNLMSKLHLHNVAGLTRLAIEKGLVERREPPSRNKAE